MYNYNIRRFPRFLINSRLANNVFFDMISKFRYNVFVDTINEPCDEFLAK